MKLTYTAMITAVESSGINTGAIPRLLREGYTLTEEQVKCIEALEAAYHHAVNSLKP